MSSDHSIQTGSIRVLEFIPDGQMVRLERSGFEQSQVLDRSICLQAVYSKDSRFDGRFFAGATSTGLYCRNVCPAPYANPEGIHFFPCVTSAESAGFRPCKRCRPRAAPGSGAWLGTLAVVSRATRLILEGALSDGSVEDLAERLGLGSRQLRRLFVHHLGSSPLKIAIAHRVQLATRLLDEPELSITQIAFRSGFSSIREFNHAVRLSTGNSPSDIRRSKSKLRAACRPAALELRLSYKGPYDWASLIAFLKPRAIPGVELVTEFSYQRTIEMAGVQGVLTVKPDQARSRLAVHLQMSGYEGLASTVDRIRRMFDLRADPVQIARHLSRDLNLHQLLKLRPGLRVPGVWDGFEAAVLSVLGQQLTSPGHREPVTRFVQMFGTPVETPIQGLRYLFPKPEVVAVADLAKAGISNARADLLRKVSSFAMRKHLSFEASRSLEQVVAQIRTNCGIDESKANYIAMRAYGEPDAFPSKERGLRRRLVSMNPALSAKDPALTAELWRPWRSYAAMLVAQ